MLLNVRERHYATYLPNFTINSPYSFSSAGSNPLFSLGTWREMRLPGVRKVSRCLLVLSKKEKKLFEIIHWLKRRGGTRYKRKETRGTKLTND